MSFFIIKLRTWALQILCKTFDKDLVGISTFLTSLGFNKIGECREFLESKGSVY